jgi:GGDEF domain-containing protein
MLPAVFEHFAPAMPLQGPFLVVADNPASSVVEALRAAGAFPIVESPWADAAQSIDSVAPEAVVLAEPCGNRERADEYARALADRLSAAGGPFRPIIARTRDDGVVPLPEALAISATAPPTWIARRLNAALRIRALHGTVLRRMEMLASHGDAVLRLASSDPLDESTVLVAGRGRTYPVLSVALGERVSLIGALSVENAARALNARDIDGIVIGDGFSPRVVEALLTVLAEDARFRDLPVALFGGSPHAAIEKFAALLPNLDRAAEAPARLIERFLPFVRLHAFAGRLKRMLSSLDAKGLIDPETGLLAREAFWSDLNRAVTDAEKRGVGLSMARFAFEHGDGRVSLDAARLVSRLMRQVDFACHEADNSIFAVFTETDLRAAHVIARRIASVLKHTMLAPDRRRSAIETAITLATLKPTDSVETLIARVADRAMAVSAPSALA